MAILSANDPTSFTCVFGISRAGAVWCPINPRNEAAENRELLDLFDCTALLFQKSFAPLVAPDRARPAASSRSSSASTPTVDGRARLGRVPGPGPSDPATSPTRRPSAVDDLAMIVGTGGTTGRPKGVMLTDANLETMTALTLMGYPFARPADRTSPSRRSPTPPACCASPCSRSAGRS